MWHIGDVAQRRGRRGLAPAIPFQRGLVIAGVGQRWEPWVVGKRPAALGVGAVEQASVRERWKARTVRAR